MPKQITQHTIVFDDENVDRRSGNHRTVPSIIRRAATVEQDVVLFAEHREKRSSI
jgi:hypothetical protein